jgi:hypothetical protein
VSLQGAAKEVVVHEQGRNEEDVPDVRECEDMKIAGSTEQICRIQRKGAIVSLR